MYYVYWNLHKKMFSVKYKGIVLGHISSGLMHHVQLRVSAKGRRKALRERKKNVHAYVVAPEIYASTKRDYALFENLGFVTYNPYHYDAFVYRDTKEPVFSSRWVYLNTWIDADGNIVPTVAVGYYKNPNNLTEHNLITTHQNLIRKVKMTKTSTSKEVRRVKNIMTSLQTLNIKKAKKVKPKPPKRRLRWYDKGFHLVELSSQFVGYTPLKKGEKVQPNDVFVHMSNNAKHIGRKENGSVQAVKFNTYPCGLVASGHGVVSDRIRVFRNTNAVVAAVDCDEKAKMKDFALRFVNSVKDIAAVKTDLISHLPAGVAGNKSKHNLLCTHIGNVANAAGVTLDDKLCEYLFGVDSLSTAEI